MYSSEIKRLETQLQGIEAGTATIGPADALAWQIEDIISGRRRSVQIKHSTAIQYSQALLPSTLTILCGSPGVSKSLWLQEVLMDLHFRGVAVAYMHLEEDRIYHLRRAVAQLAGCSNYTDEEWVRQHADEARAITAAHMDQANSFANTITDCRASRASYTDILAWCKKQVEAGARVLAVDPITLARKVGKNIWEADEEFICAAGRVIEKTGASLVLVSHPAKSNGKGGGFMDNLAGGAGLSRYCQTLFWLETVTDTKPDARVVTNVGSFAPDDDQPVNRLLHLVKTRNGRGSGKQIAYHFDVSSLRHHELGIYVEGKKGRR